MSGSENYCEDNSEGGPTGSRERTCSFKQGGRSGRAPLRRRHLKREEESLAKLCEKTAWQRGRRVQRARGGRIRGRGRGQGRARRWCDRSGVNDRERERHRETDTQTEIGRPERRRWRCPCLARFLIREMGVRLPRLPRDTAGGEYKRGQPGRTLIRGPLPPPLSHSRLASHHKHGSGDSLGSDQSERVPSTQ